MVPVIEVRPAPVPGALNLARATLGAAAADPATARRPAFTFVHPGGDRTFTYDELWQRVQAIGRGLLARGLAPSDRVLLRLPHSPEYALAFFGATVAGLVPIPTSPQLTGEEAAFLLADADASAIVTVPDMRLRDFRGLETAAADLERLDGPGPLPETQAEDAAFLIYTSGTASRPKGVLHAHRTLIGRAMMVGPYWQDFRPTDTTMHAGTLNWSYTLGVGLMDPWLVGAHAMLYGGDHDPKAWPSILARCRVSVFAAVPTVFRQMLKYGRPEDADLSALRHCLCGGEPLSPALAGEWRRRAGAELYEALGMTEVSTYISSGPATPARPGSPGRPQRGRRVVVLPEDGGEEPLPPGEVGLLAVHRSDPGLMLGYWQRPGEQAAAFRGEWFVGGDRAAIDEDGYVWFHGRADDVFKSFGYRLSPVEIEAALASCEGVGEVAVAGVPVTDGKTLVTACVVPKEGARLDEAALRAHAERHLAGYKRPHQYRFVETLPRSRTGKVLRRVLLDQLRSET